MKKSVRFLIPFLALNSLSLFGCKNSTEKADNRLVLTYGDFHINDKVNNDFFYHLDSNYQYSLSYQELENKINNKNENFILCIASSETCNCWATLSYIAKQFMVNTKSIIYRMTIDQFDEKDNLGINLIDGDSTLVLFKEGSLYEQFSSSTSEVLQDYDSFNTYIFNKLVPPKMIFINENDFYDFTYENPIYKSTIYFYRSGCEDCKSANRLILNSYFNNHKNSKPLYLLDCQNYFDELDDEEYKNKKDELCIAESSDSKFGYKDGVFPTFLYFEESTPKSGAVIYNETIEKDGNLYKVMDSYYSSDRISNLDYLSNFNGTKVLNNLVINENEITEYELNEETHYLWKKESSNKFYKPLLETFLNYYLPKTNI